MDSSRTILRLTDSLEAMRSRHLRFLRTGQDLLPRARAKFCSAARLLHDAVVSCDEACSPRRGLASKMPGQRSAAS